MVVFFYNATSQQEATVELQERSRGYMPDSHNAGSSSEYIVFESKYLATRTSKGRGVGRPRGVMYFTQCTTLVQRTLCCYEVHASN